MFNKLGYRRLCEYEEGGKDNSLVTLFWVMHGNLFARAPAHDNFNIAFPLVFSIPTAKLEYYPRHTADAVLWRYTTHLRIQKEDGGLDQTHATERTHTHTRTHTRTRAHTHTHTHTHTRTHTRTHADTHAIVGRQANRSAWKIWGRVGDMGGGA
jgi:hypothetical protein